MSMIRRFAALLAAALLAGPALAQTPTNCPPLAQTPSAEQWQASLRDTRDRGFLWRIRKEGRDSYLYGTIHVGKLDWVFPGKTVSRALNDADTLALELDPADPAVLKGLTATHNKVAVPLPLRERLERQFSAACVPSTALAPLHPVLQAVTLTVLTARWDGLDPVYAQEQSLAGLARAAQRPVVSLETVESQLAALVPQTEASMIQQLESMLTLLERNRVRSTVVRMGGAWERGDLAELESYEQWCDCINNDEERAWMQRLNDDRNPHLADKIDGLHQQGKKVFAAVGALHMTGPKALPLLMAERGYVVERMVFDK